MATTVMDIDARIEEHMSQIDRLKTRRKTLVAKERERAEQAAAWADAKREECFETARKLRLCTFEADDRKNPKVSMAGERYADTFAKNDPYGLLLYGGVGGGKTYMAAAIANRVIDRGFTAFQTDIGIGAQRSTEYMMQNVYAVRSTSSKCESPYATGSVCDTIHVARFL